MCIFIQKHTTTTTSSRVQCPNRPNGWDVFAGWTQSKFRGPRWETYGRYCWMGSTRSKSGDQLTSWGWWFYHFILSFTRVLAPSKRWLALGFLNHQQYQTSIIWFSEFQHHPNGGWPWDFWSIKSMIHNRTMSVAVARCKTGHYNPEDKEGTQHTLPWRSVDVANQAKAKWRQWHSTNARRGRHDHESSMNQRWRSKSHVNGGEVPLTPNQMCQCRFGLYSTAGQNCFNNFASRSGAMSTLRHEGHGRWIQGHHDATGVEDP